MALICVGGVTIDRKLKSTHYLQLGTSNPVSSMSTFGGVAHNVAKNLAQLTDNIHVHSVVGDDNNGRQVIAHLKNSGINSNDILILKHQTTAHYDAILDNNGELYLALADMAIFDTIPLDLFTKSWHEWNEGDLIFLDANPPKEILLYAVQFARTKNISVCIDPVSVTKAAKIPIRLDDVYLIKPDRLEAEALTGIRINSISDCIKAGKVLLTRGVQNCIISLGSLGYVIANEDIQQHFPAILTDSIVDVSGAGDAFIAGILYALKQGASIVDACQLGAALAALTVQSPHTVNETITLSKLKTLQINTVPLDEMNHAAIF